MQQPPPPALVSTPPFPLNAITTEQIQMYLDENRKLILAILENQSLGKLADCAQYQALLQKNLMYLAAIADAQPQESTPSQPLHSVVQQGNHAQQPQASMPQQQQGVLVPKLPLQLNALRSQDQQHHLLHFQQHQQIQGHVGMRPSTIFNMHQGTQPGLSNSGSLVDARGSKNYTAQ